jgi:hypothetical protein
MSAWTRIAHTEVGSGGAANITFSSIANTFTDLALFVSLRSNQADTYDYIELTFNGSTSNYSLRSLYAAGSGGAVSGSVSGKTFMEAGMAGGNSATSSTFGNAYFYIPNYAGSTNKSVSGDLVTENNASQAWQWIIAGLWSDTTAINSIGLTARDGSLWLEYSSATLYGITKGSSGGVTVS